MECLRIRPTSHEHALAELRQHELLRDAARRRFHAAHAPSGRRGVRFLSALLDRVMAIGRAAGAREAMPPTTSMVPDCG